MFYKLQDHIALRGWFGDPFAYINYNDGLIYKLNKYEMDILKQCDGDHNIIKNEIIDLFLKGQVITECEKNDSIESWQKFRFCANNCFSTVYWSITGRCNYNCKHCFMAADYSKYDQEFTLEECKKFLDSCEKCGIYSVIITGGEPLLHPHFFDIIDECNKRHIKIKEILTNASLINESVIDKLKKANINPIIKVSFDGLGWHNWMRGVEGAEIKTINAIKLLKSNGFRVQVQMCIHKDNVESIYPTAKFLDKLNIDKMRILRTCESPRWEKYNNVCLNLKEYFDVSLKFIEKYVNSNYSMPLEIFKFISIYPSYKKYRCIPIKKNGSQYDKLPACAQMRYCLNVESSGELIPCGRMTGYYKRRKVKFGNVKKDNLQQLLLDSKYFEEVSKTVKELLNIHKKCRECIFIPVCYTGCRAGAAIFSGDINSYDMSNCIYFYDRYPDKISNILSNFGYSVL